jgi:hypothetical protein
MLVRFTKGPLTAEADSLTCVRPDGSTTSGPMPRQGILPHDAFHFVVEATLGWHDAFFGHVARGATVEEISSRVHGQQREWSKMTQAQQAEALIESLQTEQSAGVMDPAAFAAALVGNCRRRGVPPPDIDVEELERVRVALRAFGAAWRPLAPGASIERRFSAT